MWPQLVYAALLMTGIGIGIARFGETRTRTYDLIDVLVGPAICVALLWWGGFWRPLFGG